MVIGLTMMEQISVTKEVKVNVIISPLAYLYSSRLVVVSHLPSIRVRQDFGVLQPPQANSPSWL